LESRWERSPTSCCIPTIRRVADGTGLSRQDTVGAMRVLTRVALEKSDEKQAKNVRMGARQLTCPLLVLLDR
jgi:hypothetical protein